MRVPRFAFQVAKSTPARGRSSSRSLSAVQRCTPWQPESTSLRLYVPGPDAQRYATSSRTLDFRTTHGSQGLP
eukprot:13988894-Alexandrium_andersonii.AAC.1